VVILSKISSKISSRHRVAEEEEEEVAKAQEEEDTDAADVTTKFLHYCKIV
jgi:hypothetical protein